MCPLLLVLALNVKIIIMNSISTIKFSCHSVNILTLKPRGGGLLAWKPGGVGLLAINIEHVLPLPIHGPLPRFYVYCILYTVYCIGYRIKTARSFGVKSLYLFSFEEI